MVFFFPFLSSSLSFKIHTETTKEKRKRRDTRRHSRARDDDCKRTAAEKQSLSSPQKLLSPFERRERERERETEREQKRKREELVVLRETFFFPLREKKSASLISSHLISVGKITRVVLQRDGRKGGGGPHRPARR